MFPVDARDLDHDVESRALLCRVRSPVEVVREVRANAKATCATQYQLLLEMTISRTKEPKFVALRLQAQCEVRMDAVTIYDTFIVVVDPKRFVHLERDRSERKRVPAILPQSGPVTHAVRVRDKLLQAETSVSVRRISTTNDAP